MTPAARIAAAIEVLDSWRAGRPAEQALTRWARQSRFAGSKDRAAVRDHVFDVLRSVETSEAYGGDRSGRALMIGLLRARGEDPAAIFTGEGHAPEPLSEQEKDFAPRRDAKDRWNLPAWLIPHFKDSLGQDALATAQALQCRAPVTIRVNQARMTRETAQACLKKEGILTTENPLCALALTVTEGARRLRNSTPYRAGDIELQDAASQAVVDLIPAGATCLDYCAGGGGKSLALAAQPDREVFAFDKNANRMADLVPRATRAGAKVDVLAAKDLQVHAPYDVVLCDAPCSGSGAWRRSPDAKWAFTADRLCHLRALQNEILSRAAGLTRKSGVLVYATCSVLKSENEEAIADFLKTHPDWSCVLERRFDINSWGDGFYTAHLTRSHNSAYST